MFPQPRAGVWKCITSSKLLNVVGTARLISNPNLQRVISVKEKKMEQFILATTSEENFESNYLFCSSLQTKFYPVLWKHIESKKIYNLIGYVDKTSQVVYESLDDSIMRDSTELLPKGSLWIRDWMDFKKKFSFYN
jgi:hypothetical protein